MSEQADLAHEHQRQISEAADALAKVILADLSATITAAWNRATDPHTYAITAAGWDPAALGPIAAWQPPPQADAILTETFKDGGITAVVSAGMTSPAAKLAGDAALTSPVFDRAAEDYLSVASNRLVGIGDAAWNEARSTLTDAFGTGVPREQMKPLLQDVLDVSEHRADTIARTEVNMAANAGVQSWGSVLSDAGFTTTKVWYAMDDARTRPTHREADGQEVGLDEPFNVGGYDLDFPGDPNGPAEEVVNCRCTHLIQTADGATEVDDEGDDEGPQLPEWMDRQVWQNAHAKVAGLDWTQNANLARRTQKYGELAPTEQLLEVQRAIQEVGDQVYQRALWLADATPEQVPELYTDAEREKALQAWSKARTKSNDVWNVARREFTAANPEAGAEDASRAADASAKYKRATTAENKAQAQLETIRNAQAWWETDPAAAQISQGYRDALAELRPFTADARDPTFIASRDADTFHRSNLSRSGWDARTADATDRWAQELITEAADYYPDDWRQRMFDYDIVAGKVQRGYQVERDHVVTIAVSEAKKGVMPGTGARTISGFGTSVHELGHLAETADPRLRALEWTFLHDRTAVVSGEDAYGDLIVKRERKKAMAWSRSETGWDDHFSATYFGRDYGDGPRSYYEITSMSMESAFLNTNPLDLAHRQWILGILAVL
jgi:hypothetical protein